MIDDGWLDEAMESFTLLVIAADRIADKYGRDRDDKPLDWSEWVEFRERLVDAHYYVVTKPGEPGEQA